jgi:hypothetical protein
MSSKDRGDEDVKTYPQIRTSGIKMQIADLRRSSDLDRAEVHGIVDLIFGLDLAHLAVIFNFPEHRLRGLLALWLEEILEVLGDFIDLLVRSFSGWGKVVCAIDLLAI